MKEPFEHVSKKSSSQNPNKCPLNLKSLHPFATPSKLKIQKRPLWQEAIPPFLPSPQIFSPGVFLAESFATFHQLLLKFKEILSLKSRVPPKQQPLQQSSPQFLSLLHWILVVSHSFLPISIFSSP